MPNTLMGHNYARDDRKYHGYAIFSATCAIFAAAANLGLYALGRAANAALRVDPGAGEPNHLIVPADVAWKSVAPLAIGALVLAFAARISKQWTIAIMVIGIVIAAISVPLVFLNSRDATTGLLLASMHTIVAAAFAVIGAAACRFARK
jgi:Family of unknown function (DUF6069)